MPGNPSGAVQAPVRSSSIVIALAAAALRLAAPADGFAQAAAPPRPPAPDTSAAREPFAFADFTWLNGTTRQKSSLLDTKYFTGEFRLDASYIYSFNHPQDHTLTGSSESGRTMEFQVQQVGIGGDFHFEHVRGRLMTQFGMYSTMTPRNDASPARGQWDLANAYRYLSEAYGGYHWNTWNGINLDAGIFMSYVGLFSYYNFDNWAYQPSDVSSNTPWFFNGVRLQTLPRARRISPPTPATSITHGMLGHVRLHARPVHDLPLRAEPPRRERALLRRAGRQHAARRKLGRGRLDCGGVGARPAQVGDAREPLAAHQAVSVP